MPNKKLKVLIDTNLWIDFMHHPLPAMQELLRNRAVVSHPCIIGEFLSGSVKHREMMYGFVRRLPRIEEADFDDAMHLLESKKLWGKGLQWNDIVLLASAKLSGIPLWTRDKRLALAAEELGVGWSE
jgi:predicted nucleic acid-binding protein